MQSKAVLQNLRQAALMAAQPISQLSSGESGASRPLPPPPTQGERTVGKRPEAACEALGDNLKAEAPGDKKVLKRVSESSPPRPRG